MTEHNEELSQMVIAYFFYSGQRNNTVHMTLALNSVNTQYSNS